MLTLIHAPQSRSSRIVWLLEELGADYEIRYVSIRRWDGSGGPDDEQSASAQTGSGAAALMAR